MRDPHSIGIAEKIDGKPGQRLCTAAALARHNFLLSQFKEFPIPDSAAVQLRFLCMLPRAQSLHQAVNLAMADADVKVPKGSVEISAEQEHQMLSLLGLFVQAEPEIVDGGDSLKGKTKRKTYAYYCKQGFMVEPGRTAEQALATTYPYRAPRVIVGLLKVRSEIFHVTHTALRKAACSPITSAAHSAFHLATPAIREWIVDVIDKAFNSANFGTAEEVIEVVRAELTEGANDSWRKSFDGILLHNLFTAFADQDWFDMLCYFFIWPGAVARQKAA
jgi:hypothetical protein